jgi:glucoamylase
VKSHLKATDKRQIPNSRIWRQKVGTFLFKERIKISSALLRFAFCLLPFAFASAQGFGTSVLPDSKVWFTLRDGWLSEAHYPNLKTQNLTSLYFIVTDGKSFAVSERAAEVTKQFAQTNAQALSFQQTNAHAKRKFTLTKRYCAYPDYSTVLIDVALRAPANYQVYVVFDPALANTEANDTAAQLGGQGAFSAYKGDLCAALIADKGFAEMSVDVVGANDGLQRLLRNFKLTRPNPRADKSNVLCIARIKEPKHFTLALSFADTPEKALVEAEHCLEADFAETLADYEKGWSDWLKTNSEPQSFPSARFAAMLRKARAEK